MGLSRSPRKKHYQELVHPISDADLLSSQMPLKSEDTPPKRLKEKYSFETSNRHQSRRDWKIYTFVCINILGLLYFYLEGSALFLRHSIARSNSQHAEIPIGDELIYSDLESIPQSTRLSKPELRRNHGENKNEGFAGNDQDIPVELQNNLNTEVDEFDMKNYLTEENVWESPQEDLELILPDVANNPIKVVPVNNLQENENEGNDIIFENVQDQVDGAELKVKEVILIDHQEVIDNIIEKNGFFEEENLDQRNELNQGGDQPQDVEILVEDEAANLLKQSKEKIAKSNAPNIIDSEATQMDKKDQVEDKTTINPEVNDELNNLVNDETQDLIQKFERYTAKTQLQDGNVIFEVPNTLESEILNIEKHEDMNDMGATNQIVEDEQNEARIEQMGALNTYKLKDNLVLWLNGMEGIEIESSELCQEESQSSCAVQSWENTAFKLEQDQLKQVFTPIGEISPIVRPNLGINSVIQFSCPMITSTVALKMSSLTLFFVLTPEQIISEEVATQTFFFIESTEGLDTLEFAFNGANPFARNQVVKPSLSNGLEGEVQFEETVVEATTETFVGSKQWMVLVYRVDNTAMLSHDNGRNSLQLRLNGQKEWISNKKSDNTVDTPDTIVEQNKLQNNFVSVDRRSRTIIVGNNNPSCSQNAFHGMIAEILVYEELLPDEQIITIEHRLQMKWLGGLYQEENEVVPVESINEIMEKTPIMSFNMKQNEDPITEDKETQALENTESANLNFGNKNIFKWLPAPEDLSRIEEKREKLPADIVDEWKNVVSAKTEEIKTYPYGSDRLRDFIHNKKVELEAIRQELFG